MPKKQGRAKATAAEIVPAGYLCDICQCGRLSRRGFVEGANTRIKDGESKIVEILCWVKCDHHDCGARYKKFLPFENREKTKQS